MIKVGLISGITGQDGSYLAELLLDKGYHVWGIIRRSSTKNTSRIAHIMNSVILKYGDLTDYCKLANILSDIKKTYKKRNIAKLEIYNLAAMSHVKVSFDIPEYTTNVNGVGVVRFLEAIRSSGMEDIIRFYQASTSELYGKVAESPQNERTPFYPRSPYGVSKLYGYWITKNYRESYNMFACNGILFNHDSPRRQETFVTRKITMGLAHILAGIQDKLILGNIDAKRDWGHAKDYVEGMWRILQADTPDDYVLATNKMHSVRDFVETAFALKGIDIGWKGSDINEVGYDKNTGRELIYISEEYFRPVEVDELCGCAEKAKRDLGWTPNTSFEQMVKEMVEYDYNNISN